MIRQLCWKEYREQRWIWLVVAAATVLLVFALAAILSPAGLDLTRADARTRTVALTALAVMAVVYGLVCGSMLLAGEREAHTLVWLDTLSGRRAPVWRAKVLAGAVFTLAQAAVLTGLALPLEPQPAHTTAPPLWALPVLALDGYAWGLAASALASTGFGAAILGCAFLALTWILSGAVSAALPGAVLASRVVFMVGAVALSGRAFCEPDRRRTAPPAVARRAAPAGIGSWRVLLWLTVRQGWVEAVLVLAGAVLLGFVLSKGELVAVSGVALLAGVVCGTAVFADEQSGGAFRFLGDQRFPPGRVWGVKTLCWFLVAAVATSAATVIVALGHTSGPGPRNLLEEVLGEYLGVRVIPLAVLALALLAGFAGGQLAGMLFRRRLSALAVGGGAGATLTALWLPSLLLGGLPLWQVFGPPLLLLLGGRLVMSWWASDRLASRRPVACLLGCLLLSGMWMAGCFWWRVEAIPDPGAPFDQRAYVTGLNEAARSEAGDLIRQGAREVQAHQTVVMEQFGQAPQRKAAAPAPPPPAVDEKQPAEGAEPDGTPLTYQELAAEVADKGWPKDAPELGRWLDRMFAGEWADKFRKAAAAPIGLVEDPRRTSLISNLPYLDGTRLAGTLFVARALQLQARGDPAAALEHLNVALGLSRQLRNDTLLIYVLAGAAVQTQALDGLDRWMERLGPRKDLLRRAGQILKDHEDRLPPFAGAVKAEYYSLRNTLDEIAAFRTGIGSYLYALAQQVPWEKARARRLLDLFIARELKWAELPYWEIEPPRPAGAAGGQPDPQRKQQRELVSEPWAAAFMASLPGRLAPALSNNVVIVGKAAGLCRIRAARLCVALALYQAETGKPAGKLADLVPRYLKELPADPFSGQPFHYRVSQGEAIEWPGETEAAQKRAVPAGQGVVWSVGLDGKDNGGRKQGEPNHNPNPQAWADAGLDWIFLVPQWPKR